jgi:Ribbon-helix-helix domain
LQNSNLADPFLSHNATGSGSPDALVPEDARILCSDVADFYKVGGAPMKSPVLKRSIVVAGHKTSISLEDAFWEGLKEMQTRRHAADQPSDAVARVIEPESQIALALRQDSGHDCLEQRILRCSCGC